MRPATHDLYIGDVGQNAWEEVDLRTPRQQRVLNNYGWRVYEGRVRYQAGQQVNSRGVLVFPIAVYSHSQGCSITGGYVYRGKAVAFGARALLLRRLLQRHGLEPAHLPRQADVGAAPRAVQRGDLSSFGEDAAGELYATSLDGTVYKLGS